MGTSNGGMLLKGKGRNHIGRIMTIMFLVILAIEVWMGTNIRYPFGVFVLISYLIMLPKKLLNPKNMVFFFYFVWYVLGPFGSNYTRYLVQYAEYTNMAFLMLFCTYCIIMLTLDITIAETESPDKRIESIENLGQDRRITVAWPIKLMLILLLLVSLTIFVIRTGGLSNWFGSNLSAGHFSRRGSGLYSLIFQYTYYFLIFVEGQQKINSTFGLARRFVYLITLPIMFVFIASKGQMMLCIFLLFANGLVNEKLVSWKTCMLGFTGVSIYIVNMFIRIGNWKDSLGHTLNYFDTLEKFLMVLRDYKPEFFKTFYMPFTWPFVKTGLLPSTIHYDFNIWLTDVYNHNKWAVLQATDQWNIETDMYLNFGYAFGIPLVILLFYIVGLLYKKCIYNGGVWIYIYILEFLYCGSHLRGGIILYWYWFLIPIYFWLILRYAKDSKYKIVFKR